MKDAIDLCFIGNGSHAGVIKNTLCDLNIKHNIVVFNRELELSKQPEVLNCAAIFIVSPNNTHAYYLRELNSVFNGYIYCEKPPVNQISEISILDEVNSSKLFFGFNYRYSDIGLFIADMSRKYGLGKMINMSIHVSYPFAIKEKYSHSWKSNVSNSPYGIIENLGIHYIDLSVTLLGRIKNIFISKRNIGQTGAVVDTATICCEHDNDATTQIFVSYISLVKDEMYFTFENGDVSYDGSVFTCFYPTACFGDSGLAIRPPAVCSLEVGEGVLYDNSMRNCLKEFMSVVMKKGSFDPCLFHNAKISVLAMFGLTYV